MNPAAHFSQTYREARNRCLEAATRRGVAVETHIHPYRGAEGEELASDVALIGDPGWSRALIASSGTHGVEGFCGSGCQLALLQDDVLLGQLERRKVAVILIHAVNPFGFSHLHRTNEDNVDLNRNFRDFSQPAPVNAVYERLHPLLVPAAWPPDPKNEAALAAAQAALDENERRSLTGGQSAHPDGLFYAGQEPAWSNKTVRQVLRRHAAGRRAVAWIDLHTGLGPYGHGEKIFAALDPQITARAKRWWGEDLILSSDPDSVSPRTLGYITRSAYEECPDAAVTTMTLEYGTVPQTQVHDALRADAWLRSHPSAPPSLRADIKRAIRDAFYCDTDAWKGMILGQFRATMIQTMNGIAGDFGS